MLSQVLDLFVQFTTIGGGALLVWGAVALGTSLKDQNGPGIQAGMWQVVGGGLIIAAAQIFKAIAL
ncbi:hypothetical protein [Bifidobacterium miconisargentati]|uniref:hypothetical protein n=1 Tax=Bifidobacterium miconisargentati TaxID=2834437 RepID=UPI001BDCDC06|nr:hypothetical protein [Bifidobacterium miconisargentati]